MGAFNHSSVTTAPKTEPVTLDDVKEQLIVEDTDSDGRLGELIVEARGYVEAMTGYRLVRQTVQLYRDDFDDYMELPFAPLASIASIYYYNASNVLTLLATSSYTVNANKIPGTIRLADGQAWPSVYDREDAVVIQMLCGYLNETKVPLDFRRMIYLYCRWAFLDDMEAKTSMDRLIQSRKINWHSNLRV